MRLALKKYVTYMMIAFAFGLIGFQGYALYLSGKCSALGIPAHLGNTDAVRQAVESANTNGTFSFVAVGDTRGTGTFGGMIKDINAVKPRFVVLLGDCVNNPTEDEHAYFRMECANEFKFNSPTFFIPGNHDLSPTGYPISRFEADYGPSNFSFVVNNCLFICVRFLHGYADDESLAFLRGFLAHHPEQYRKRFVLMHVPPVVSPDIGELPGQHDAEVEGILAQLHADYVLASHFHGYNRTRLGDVEYIITGGGGAHLNESRGPQFHHAIELTVGDDFVSERILPAASRFDLVDWLNQNAVIFLAPLIKKNLTLVACLDAALLLLVVWLWRLRKMR